MGWIVGGLLDTTASKNATTDAARVKAQIRFGKEALFLQLSEAYSPPKPGIDNARFTPLQVACGARLATGGEASVGSVGRDRRCRCPPPPAPLTCVMQAATFVNVLRCGTCGLRHLSCVAPAVHMLNRVVGLTNHAPLAWAPRIVQIQHHGPIENCVNVLDARDKGRLSYPHLWTQVRNQIRTHTRGWLARRPASISGVDSYHRKSSHCIMSSHRKASLFIPVHVPRIWNYVEYMQAPPLPSLTCMA